MKHVALASLALVACTRDVPQETPAGLPPTQACTCTVSTFDAEGELQSEVLQTYDDAGHLVISEPLGSDDGYQSWSYLGDRLVESAMVQRGGVVERNTYEHDDQGRITGVHVVEGPATGRHDRFTYNDYGLLSSEVLGADGALAARTTFEWVDGRLVGWDREDDDGTVRSSGTRDYLHVAPNLDHIETRSSDTQDPQVSERRYDADGRILERLEISSSGAETAWSYTYDPDGRLLQVVYENGSSDVVVDYTYDAIGREITRTSVPTLDQTTYAGRIESQWSCEDQAPVPSPTVPGLKVVLFDHPLHGPIRIRI